MKELLTILAIIFIGSLSTNCESFISQSTDSVYMDYDHAKLGYKLYKPTKKHFLNYDLEEISGLSYYKDGLLAAVEDEGGDLFILDAATGEIKREIDFGNSGDYEGVEIIDNHAYILESDGDIYDFEITDDDKVDAVKTETILERKNDAEGLGFIKGNLAIALKGDEDTDDNKTDGKAIYAYNISKKELVENELFDIEEDDLNDFVSKRKYFNKVNDFDPSAIAVHPITGDVYVLSADRVLVVLTPGFELKEVIRLSSVTYNQAEGLCFSPNGTMYISSEGDGGKGKLMTINYAN
ncbi:hypothetical protein E1176_16405 [Fulvivirga sp. RKSG066]|uniref:SdiA-regulated domain-containing protein n=1 Tax=Fulvivirga aurantia TaxID=2529383 RepID=UPI0012BBAAAD|nr:SdiA-regulated domain-containing protein [Fulvivirga aurantia]MTI22615.1 hypothetical protein [Fulvivirga aurantia]